MTQSYLLSLQNSLHHKGSMEQKQKLDQILILINEAIQADDSGTCHLIIARSAVENAIKAIERSVAFIMEQQHCQTGSSHDFEGLYNTEEC